MILYKLKHIPTGLYFIPSHTRNAMGNFSKKGKLYDKKPSISWTNCIRIKLNINRKDEPNEYQKRIIEFFGIEETIEKYGYIDKHFETPETDWEIESYEVSEIS